MSDKMPSLQNVITVAGALLEIEVRKGKTKKDKYDYVSMKAKVQVGATEAEYVEVERFEQAKKKPKTGKNAGKESDNVMYKPLKDFVDKAVSKVKATEEKPVTMCEFGSEFDVNDFINKKNNHIEGNKIVPKWFNDYKGTPKAQADVAGRIVKIKEEMFKEVETGRLIVNIVTTNFFGNLIPINGIIIPKEWAEPFQAKWEEGHTATFSFDYELDVHDDEAVVVEEDSNNGLGCSDRSTGGQSYMKKILKGVTNPKDEDQSGAIGDEPYAIAKKERKAIIDKLKADGYKGSGGTSSGSGESNRGNLGENVSSPSQDSKNEVDDDDDIPF